MNKHDTGTEWNRGEIKIRATAANDPVGTSLDDASLPVASQDVSEAEVLGSPVSVNPRAD